MSHHSAPLETNRPARVPATAPDVAASLDTWGDDLREELERLAAEQRELLGAAGAQPEGATGHREVERLQRENADLHQRVAELERALADQPAADGEEWKDQQAEYEALLEEKSEVIRALHLKIQELRDGAASHGAAPAPASARGSVEPANQQDLLQLRQELEERRQQLEEDEEALMQQMKQMEVSMAKERAELARQRTELQRLHNDLRHEIEQASRDTSLRERLAPLQRRHQDATGRRGTPTMTDISIPDDERLGDHAAPRQSGLFRRLLGG